MPLGRFYAKTRVVYVKKESTNIEPLYFARDLALIACCPSVEELIENAKLFGCFVKINLAVQGTMLTGRAGEFIS